MVLSKEQQEKLVEAARPLIKLLNDPEYHPHVNVVVDSGSVKFNEMSVHRKVEDYYKD